MNPETWISDETKVVSIALRALGRARHRPARIIAVAALAAAAFVGYRLHAPPTYQAALHFHLAEGPVTDPTHAPRPPRAVREYVSNVALSRARVEQIMRKYGWSTRYLARDRVAAVDEFREDVSVDVVRNYFVYDRRPSDPPRSATVTVSLVGTDPETTAATVHEIGDAILEEQRAQRADRLAQARLHLEAELVRARARTKYLQETIGRLEAEATRSGPVEAIQMRTQAAALRVEAGSAIEQVGLLERRASDVAFTEAAEGEDLGLRLELVDESLLALTPPLTPLELARRALVVFVIVALLAVPVVGGFDDLIYAPSDLAVRGLPCLGSLERFPGDDVGSYLSRVPARSG